MQANSVLRGGLRNPVINPREARSLLQRSFRLVTMAQKQAKLVVLGSSDFPDFEVLKYLPKCAEVVAIGSMDEVLRVGDDKLAEADVLLNTGFGVRTDQRRDIEKIWPKLPNLKWMHTASAGVTHILTQDLVNSDVTLTNAKGCFSHSLAEYAITACTHFAKRIPELQANQRAGVWEPLYVEELRGTRMGIVGYGDIGQTTAKLARAFGMQIAALRRHSERSKEEQAHGLQVFTPDKLIELMASCDYIVAALPATPATEKLISKAAIAAMKPNAVFINLGRGTTVDEAALIQALQEKRIRGAALDVFAEEPLPKASPLWQLGNVLVSPHCADRTRTFLRESIQQFVEIVKLYVDEKPLTNVCDKEAGY